jgi:ADP-ribose pyrophosphatase YjhB (NUDIX family)
MIQRGSEPMKYYWSLPGGKLELGETLIQGAKREVNNKHIL